MASCLVVAGIDLASLHGEDLSLFSDLSNMQESLHLLIWLSLASGKMVVMVIKIADCNDPQCRCCISPCGLPTAAAVGFIAAVLP